MLENAVIPNADPTPLPAPVFLLKFLMILMFILHILAMNITVGGGVIAVVSGLKAKTNEKLSKLCRSLAKVFPFSVAATITLGVAPLLFLQVIYGQLFYTSSVILAWPWITVIPILIIAYYGFYWFAFKGKEHGHGVGVALGTVLLFMVIGFFYVNNMSLSAMPEKFITKYTSHPSGANLFLEQRFIIPRYLHFMVGATAIAGLFVIILGLIQKKKDLDQGNWMMRTGAKWFLYMTMAQVLIGIWFLITLPKDIMMLFMGRNILATMFLIIAFLLALFTLVILSRASKDEILVKPLWSSIGLAVIIMVLMILMRDILRTAFLKPTFQVSSLAVQTQFGPLILFLATFVIGLGVMYYMLQKLILVNRNRAK